MSSSAGGAAGTLGPFRLLSVLAEGEAASVYKACISGRRAPVALKVFHHAPGREARVLDRCRREAWLVKELQHPHIVRVFAFGHYSGLPYISMQYCPGGSLADAVRRAERPLPWPRTLTIAQQIGSALTWVHSRQVVHGDVKPGNVLFDGDGHALLTDFGCVSAAFGPASGWTPAYAAPEQFRGGPVDARTDLYGLAALMVAVLAGPGALDEPPGAVVHTLPGAPRRVREILARALSPDAAQRYASVDELVGRLAAAL